MKEIAIAAGGKPAALFYLGMKIFIIEIRRISPKEIEVRKHILFFLRGYELCQFR
jgi:hypothetical protein